jgi:hypothetical protein
MASIEPSTGWPAGGVAGFFIGGLFGSTIGIAGFGTAIAGTVPIGILGAWLAYRHGRSVVEWMSRKDGNEVLRDVEQAAIRTLDQIIPDSTDQTSAQGREERINAIVIQLLFFQAGLAGVAPTEIRWSRRAADDWSIGYVWGFNAAFVEWTGGGPDMAGFANMAMLFITLYGEKKGAELCGRALRLQERYHPTRTKVTQAFPHGVMAGWREARDWLTSRGEKVPLRWFERLNQGL